MATEVTAATLTITITESLELDGEDRGGSVVQTIASVTEYSKRLVNVPTTEINLLSFQATTPGAGTYNEADVRYIRISNRDDTNHVVLVFTDDSGTESARVLDAGNSLVLFGDNSAGVVDVMIASGSALTVTSAVCVGDLVTISGIADTAACDVELVVAGT